ncbi:MAG: hypothetical protein Q9217_004566 [Psora testacea]
MTPTILIAGAVLLILLTLLGGAIDKNPTNRFYFLQAETSGIAGAASTTRWTFWNACSVINGRNACPDVHPAYPLNPPSNFPGPNDGIPEQFIGTSHYYYLTRFMFAFVLIGLFFAVCSLFLGLLALCSRIGSFLAAYVQGRDAFHSNSRPASLGRYTFGFMWAAVACLFLSTVFFCAGGAADSSGGRKERRGFGRGMFGQRNRSVRRDRGSFIDRSSFESKSFGDQFRLPWKTEANHSVQKRDHYP